MHDSVFYCTRISGYPLGGPSWRIPLALINLCTDIFLVMYKWCSCSNRMQKSALCLGKCIPRRRMMLLPGEKKNSSRGSYLTEFRTVRLRPGVQSLTSRVRGKGVATGRLTLTLLYTIFDREINPFIFFMLITGSAFI